MFQVHQIKSFCISKWEDGGKHGVIYSAAVWPNLMEEAGIADRSGCTGGDWGSAITTVLGALHSDHCKAIHVNLCFAPPNWLNPWHMAQVRTVTHYLLQESSVLCLPEVLCPRACTRWHDDAILASMLCIQTCVYHSTSAGCWCMFDTVWSYRPSHNCVEHVAEAVYRLALKD